MADITATLAKNIKSHRNKLGLTQEELARKSGIHRSHLANIERQAVSPSLKTIEALAQALDVTASDLLRLNERS